MESHQETKKEEITQKVVQEFNQLKIKQDKDDHKEQAKVENDKVQIQQSHEHPEEEQEDNEQEADNQKQQQQQQLQQQEEQIKNSKWKVIEQPKNTIQLYMIDFAQCDSKKCSGKKMERFNLLTSIKQKEKKKKFRGVVLSAFGKKQVCFQDLQLAQKQGICVIDCSWNRIEETREFRYKHQRKLPFVIAGNPINYGKPYQLSCAQALATALCTVGYVNQAEYILSKFGWSDGFWSLNPNISNYAKCATLQQLRKQSKSIQETKSNEFQRNYDLSSNSSDDEE